MGSQLASIVSIVWTLVIVGSLFCFLSLHSVYKSKKYSSIVSHIFVASVFVFLGALRMQIYDTSHHTTPLGVFEGDSVSLVGRVLDVTGDKISLDVFAYVKDSIVIKLENDEPILLRHVVSDSHFGDVLYIKGVLQRPSNFSGGDRDFDYVSYLKKQNIFHIIDAPEIVEQKPNTDITLGTMLNSIREWFEHNVTSVVIPPASALALGATIAAKEHSRLM